MHEILEYKFVVDELTIRKSCPPLVTVAMPDIQCSLTLHMFSRSEKYIAEQRGNWQHTDREDRAGYFWYETRSQDPQLLNCVIRIAFIQILLSLQYKSLLSILSM